MRWESATSGGSEAVVPKLRRGPEGPQSQRPAGVSSLPDAFLRPAQINERRVGRHADAGQRWRAVGGAGGRAGGGEGRRMEGVEGRGHVVADRRISLEGEGVALGRGEGVATVEGVGGGGLVAQQGAARGSRAAAA